MTALAATVLSAPGETQECTHRPSAGAEVCTPTPEGGPGPVPVIADDRGAGDSGDEETSLDASTSPSSGGSRASISAPVVVNAAGGDTIVSYSPYLPRQPGATVPVQVRADALVDEIGAIGLYCTLESSLLSNEAGSNHRLASGYAVALRQGQPIEAWADNSKTLYHIFTGHSINLTFEVPFFTDSESYYPIEYWTHGHCFMQIHHDNDEDWEFPHVCTAEMMVNAWQTGLYDERVLACVWPGTDPSLAEVRFSRPGLEGLNAVTGQLSDVTRQPGDEEDDQ